jgi:uncharacterized membrane protein YkvA (DUF1232 family)
LKSDPVGLAERLQRRLGLDIETPPSVTREVNASVYYRSGALRRLAHLGGPVVRKMSPELFYAMKFGPLHDVIFAKKRIVGPSAEQKIGAIGSLRDAFEDDISRLEDTLDRDLSAWRYEAQAAGLEPVRASAAAAAAAEAAPVRITTATAVAKPRGFAGITARLALEARALWSLAWDPKVPMRARVASLGVASYLIMPIDIIPNRIPLFGHLDEAATIPLAIALFLWLSPTTLIRRHREGVRQAKRGEMTA